MALASQIAEELGVRAMSAQRGTSKPDSEEARRGLRSLVVVGAAWSALSQVTVRAGSVLVGIVLARLFVPAEFGVYAVGLTVQAILANLADLGLSADLIRSSDPERRAPVVATLALTASSAIALIMMITSQAFADALGSPDAALVITLLAPTLVLSGLTVVPFAMLTRNFDQKRLFAVALTDLVVSSVVTIVLVQEGVGVVALALGRLLSQTVTAVLQFLLTRRRPHFGMDRSILGDVLRFGLPVAAANSISWLVLNVDNVVVARMLGPTALGFYVLAFNMSNWPMNSIGQVARSVALPAFTRVRPRAGVRDRSLGSGVAVSWALGLLGGGLIALLAGPAVHLLYGSRWASAAPVAAALGLFGALRVVFDMFATYLLARGRAALALWTQIWWLVVLVPGLLVGARVGGVQGAGWAHLVVAGGLILPGYLIAVRWAGADVGGIGRALAVPVLAGLPAAALVVVVLSRLDSDLPRLLAAGSVGGFAFLALLGGWIWRKVLATKSNGPTPVTGGTVAAGRQPAAASQAAGTP